MEHTSARLGIKLLCALVVGSTLGSGIFGLPQNMAAGAGVGAVLLGWIISGLGMLTLALVYQMLAVRKPALDNGVYAYAEALSGPYVGFNSAWGYWVSAWIGNVGYLVAAFSALGYFFPAFGEGNSLAAIGGASITLWLVHAAVLRGIQGAAVLNGVVTVAKVAPLLLFIVFAAYAFQIDTFTLNFWGEPELGSVLKQVKSTMLVTVWVFLGIEGASVYSARAQNRKDVGSATVVGFLICLILLMAVSLLSMGILSQPELAALKNPSMAPVLEKVVGFWGAWLIYGGLIISVGGGFLAWTLLAAESLFTPASHGVMPQWLTRQNSHGVPANALWLTSGMVQIFLLVTLVSNASYLALISLSTAMILVPYLFSAAYGALVAWTERDSAPRARVAERSAQARQERPNAAGDTEPGALSPWLPAVSGLATVYCIWLLYAAGPKYLLLSALLYAPGSVLFIIAKRERQETVFSRSELALLIALLLIAAYAGFMLATGRLSL